MADQALKQIAGKRLTYRQVVETRPKPTFKGLIFKLMPASKLKLEG